MANIETNIKIDMLARGVAPEIDIMQGDTFTRDVKIHLYVGAVPFVPSEYDFEGYSVAFVKPDGKTGWYDTLPDQTVAVEYTMGNSYLIAKIAPEATQAAGKVKAAVILHNGIEKQAATFPFILNVIENPAYDSSISNSYYAVKNLEELNNALKSIVSTQEDQNFTDQEKANARNNIGAMEYGVVTLVSPDGDEIEVYGENSIKDDDGYTIAGVVSFCAMDNDQKVILAHIQDGIDDSDAATVGQVNAVSQIAEDAYEAAGVAVIVNPQTLTAEQQEQARKNIGALSESAQQDIDYLRQDMDQGVFPVVNSAVTVNKQTLTDDQKAQARVNIGAIGDGDDVGGLNFVGSLTTDEGINIDFCGNVVHGVNAPETDTDAANKGYVDGLVGDIETALDSIIAIQESLIGGASA